jgi:aryl-alcohol dehydrogenase-like predicted oxidoreductase
MYAWQFSKALYLAERHGWTRFVSMQNFYNLLYREEEREMAPLCHDQGVGMIPWSPLARGRLARGAAMTETTSRSETDVYAKRLYAKIEDADRRVLEGVDAVAKARGLPNAQVSLAWLLRQKSVTAPIVGATKMHHLEDAAAATSVKLSDEECKILEAPYVTRPVAGIS